MTKIEQVARALARRILTEETGVACVTDEAKGALERSVDRLWPECVKDARAAIEAMRAPTEAMLEAGKLPTRPIPLGNGTFTEGLGLGAHASIMWPRMIDAALAEKP